MRLSSGLIRGLEELGLVGWLVGLRWMFAVNKKRLSTLDVTAERFVNLVLDYSGVQSWSFDLILKCSSSPWTANDIVNDILERQCCCRKRIVILKYLVTEAYAPETRLFARYIPTPSHKS
ncbi:hypothetical protein FVEG_16067 [Fusarium verticillioides 7600]|uniref:Uncharacterized protein n=1 Tax=Gibberella moniliformis (strain M3125 / FGSC 7600) TaxID=334819 RepID=W7M668_GIBM7|nr:hypothetical protein FVEG_16067 [Fusarium verticillioides 7600]EWG47073.1 hypothetical protein FVEG_16067 [Fusarium verticillioides 7600]